MQRISEKYWFRITLFGSESNQDPIDPLQLYKYAKDNTVKGIKLTNVQ